MVLLMRNLAIPPVSTFDSIIRSLTLVVALFPADGLQWMPIPLRIWFRVTYVCVLLAGAIALEVALHYSHKKGGTSSIPGIDNDIRLLILNGWPTKASAEKGIM